MRTMIILFCLTIFLLVQCTTNNTMEKPPVAPINTVEDLYFGKQVTDPYRYMEDLENPEVQQWIKGQANYAAKTLDEIPGRSNLLERLKELDRGKPYSTYSIIRFIDGTLYYMKRMAGENIAKLYVRYAGNIDEKLLIDPEKMTSEDGEHFSLRFYTPSPNSSLSLEREKSHD